MKRSRQINSSNASKPRRRKPQTPAELRALQRLMAKAVMRPLTPELRMRPRWSDGRLTREVSAGFIKPNDRLTSFDRLEIYNRQYWLRVLECFYEDYPGLRAVLGEGRFRDLAVAYLANHPSTSFTLRNLGAQLANYLEAQPRWAGPRYKLALDMARLEWAHIEAFDSEAMPPISADDLLDHNPARLRLHLQPHITLLQLDYPLDDFLIALRENTRLRGEASNAMDNSGKHPRARKVAMPQQRITRILIHRYNNLVYYKRIEPAQFELLAAIQQGTPLAKALSTIHDASAAQNVSEWFHDWSALGWLWIRT